MLLDRIKQLHEFVSLQIHGPVSHLGFPLVPTYLSVAFTNSDIFPTGFILIPAASLPC